MRTYGPRQESVETPFRRWTLLVKSAMDDSDFMRSIIESPDDDAPRLVYADWLEEHGQTDRSAFIRVQCELARLPEADERRASMEAKERALLPAFTEKTLAERYQKFLERSS